MKIREASTETKTKPWKVEGVEWKEVKLKEVAKIIGGNTAPQNKKFYENGKYLFVRVSDLGAKKNFDPIIDTRDKLNDEGIKRNKLVLAPKNTIVFPKSGAAILTNSRGILGREAYIVNHLAGVIALENKSSPRYLLFYLSKIDMSKYISPHSGYPSLKLETIRNLKIPIPFRNGKPDLETQKKIVEYIESNFSRVNSILEKKKKILAQLDELWESALENAFKPREGEEWREVGFLDMVNLIKGSKPKKVFNENRYNTLPYLTTEYFREKVIKKFIPIKENKLTFINKGDLVIIADGSRSGELFLCDKEGVLVSTMAKLEIKENEIYKKYLFWFLTIHFEQLNKSKYTATPHINKNHLKKLKLPLPFRNGKPELERQKEIADYLDEVYEKIKSIKEKVQFQINQLDEMKESILNEVFSRDKGK